MTIDERLDRIDIAGMVEQARKDREENRQLWRDTQRQIDDLARRTTDLAVSTAHLTAQSIELTRQMGELSIKQRDTNDTVARLSERIEALVSAIGEWMRAHG